MGTTRNGACDPTLSVNRDIDAASVRYETTWMERLELVEQGCGKLRAQPWRMVPVRFVKSFCCILWHRLSQHTQCGSRERVDVVHGQTPSRQSVDYFQTSCRHPICVSSPDQSILDSVPDAL